MKVIYFVLFVVLMFVVISRMFVVLPAIGMIACFGAGFLLAKVTQKK